MSDSQKGGEDQGRPPVTEELIELLRSRVAMRYYDQPRVIDAMARAILSSREL